MVNIQKLKGRIVEKNLNGEKVAKALNINTATWYRKLNEEGKTLTIAEVWQLGRMLDLDHNDMQAIFFA